MIVQETVITHVCTHVTQNVEQIVEANVLQVVGLDVTCAVTTPAQVHVEKLAQDTVRIPVGELVETTAKVGHCITKRITQ